ncbi:hypothetical protein BH24ACI3_BH24ACI3_15560 [soil metagenome]
MKTLLKVLLLLIVIAFPATQAFGSFSFHADEIAGRQDLRWRSKVVRLALSRSMLGDVQNIKFGTDVNAALERSLLTWEAATGIRFEIVRSDRASVSPAASAGDGISLITIAPTAENIQFLGPGILEFPGATRVFFDRNGRITEGDIVLNPIHQFSSDGTFGTFDLESVLTHEIGHLLGIGHSDIPGAVMSEQLRANGIFGRANFGGRVLTPVDLALVRSVYGNAVGTEDCCASIAGQLINFRDDQPIVGFVWIEDPETNLIVGSAPVLGDGSYSVDGLVAGNYSAYFNGRSGDLGINQRIGTVEVKNGEVDKSTTQLKLPVIGPQLESGGLNGEVVKTSIAASAGSRLTISVGGRDLRLEDVYLGLASPFFTVVPSTFNAWVAPDGSTVISFDVLIDPETEPGSYSLIAESKNRVRTYLPGAITVHRQNTAPSK